VLITEFPRVCGFEEIWEEEETWKVSDNDEAGEGKYLTNILGTSTSAF